MMNLSVRQAQFFLTLASEGNYTHAAQKLFVSQPSLTQTIHKLEQDLNVTFFYRENQQYHLTREGEIFAETCRSFLQISQNLGKQLTDLSSTAENTVSVGMPFNLGAYMFPQLYMIYQTQHSNTKFIPVEGRSPKLRQLLLRNEIDIAVMPYKNTLDHPNIGRVPIFQEEILLSVPKNHPLNEHAVYSSGRRYASIDITLTNGEDYIISAPGQTLHDICERLFKEANLSINPMFTSRSLDAKKALSAVGLGLTIMPEHYCNFYGANANANYYYILPPYNYTWDVFAFYQADSYLSLATKACIEVLQKMGHSYNWSAPGNCTRYNDSIGLL